MVNLKDEISERLLSLWNTSVEKDRTISQDDTKQIESLLTEIDADK